MATLFVSDIHLSPERPAPARCFLSFLEGPARAAEAVYILGDLFDLWLGDDHDSPLHRDTLTALAGLTETGVPVRVLHGNHDFLLGEAFTRQSGCQLLADPWVIDLYGSRVLLMHGDTLCTDDMEYQSLRQVVRNPERQRQFLALPLEERLHQAVALRGMSRQRVQEKPPEIMDVNASTVAETMRGHGVFHLIHGHTHRPAVHDFRLDGKPAIRIVLGDWYAASSVLVWEKSGYRLGAAEAVSV